MINPKPFSNLKEIDSNEINVLKVDPISSTDKIKLFSTQTFFEAYKENLKSNVNKEFLEKKIKKILLQENKEILNEIYAQADEDNLYEIKFRILFEIYQGNHVTTNSKISDFVSKAKELKIVPGYQNDHPSLILDKCNRKDINEIIKFISTHNMLISALSLQTHSNKSFSQSEITDLSNACPQIEDLRLKNHNLEQIPSSWSSHLKTARIRARNLKTLELSKATRVFLYEAHNLEAVDCQDLYIRDSKISSGKIFNKLKRLQMECCRMVETDISIGNVTELEMKKVSSVKRIKLSTGEKLIIEGCDDLQEVNAPEASTVVLKNNKLLKVFDAPKVERIGLINPHPNLSFAPLLKSLTVVFSENLKQNLEENKALFGKETTFHPYTEN